MADGNHARTFILERSAFNRSQLATEINWLPQNMNAWLKKRRSIPAGKLQKLEEVLNKYGYRQWLRFNFQT